MILPRIISPLLRVAQFVCAAIVLGLTAYFLHQREKYGVGPFGRLVYSVVIAAISVVLSLIWMIPTTSSIVNYATDLLFCAAWFAAFGVLQDWYDDALQCGSTWDWRGIGFWNGLCGQWNAAQAFSFLAAVFWFASFILGILAHHRNERATVATDGATSRKRWFRRSRV
ncbi:uncharacterized protein K460DRAFT_174158 [Cucurbitaria berberidis CBS 394.84]|uniref:MARVEL domain-containing protein n=1 Tax=Cucurbitaria berberidis CBS 394.84 TaxID=1168544 RepID=A0A9P4GAD8_9PLEO|nr:uncharacterized protein K460DRAFT_174158 [Cucurbitaria berberidis CBS 394.84]KAF1841812.1 hypothetical protein K460DRAFT_174158 [Cucurbitaria berberidis CBS 394.84]